MQIIPAIDIRDGRCVRLTQGDFSQETVYSENPADVARKYQDQGAQWLHVVDLDGAREGDVKNWHSLRSIIQGVHIPVQFGGGARTLGAVERLLEAGVRRVVLGTRLVQDAGFARSAFQEFGERVLASVDTKGGKVAISGWTESSETDARPFIEELSRYGAKRLIVTDIARDGAMEGPNLELLRDIKDSVQASLIASGGVCSLADLKALAELGLEGVIVGKALYEDRFTLDQAIQAVSVVQA